MQKIRPRSIRIFIRSILNRQIGAGLWDELYSVFEFWIERGVRVFRVDNPHTKALPFWEWCLGKLEGNYPDTIFSPKRSRGRM